MDPAYSPAPGTTWGSRVLKTVIEKDETILHMYQSLKSANQSNKNSLISHVTDRTDVQY